MITGNEPDDLLPDVKYAYDNFINSCIHYFKTIDNNDLRQAEYKECDFLSNTINNETLDISSNITNNLDANLLLMRSIKIDTPNLDKYVKKTNEIESFTEVANT